jgi:SAM-dependent methyltransferase
MGQSKYDVAILGHICHAEGAARSRDLFRKLQRALKPGGKLLIAEMVPDEERREAQFPLLFAINMLVHTEEGGTFTYSEFRKWLQEAGFKTVRTIEAPAPSPLIVAEK